MIWLLVILVLRSGAAGWRGVPAPAVGAADSQPAEQDSESTYSWASGDELGAMLVEPVEGGGMASVRKRNEWRGMQNQLKQAGFDDAVIGGGQRVDRGQPASAKKKKHRRRKNLGPPIYKHNAVPLPKPRYHADVAQSREPEYWDHERFKVPYAPASKYLSYGYLSHGGFSQVYHGRVAGSRERVVIKVLNDATDTGLAREVMMLTRMGDVDHVIPLLDVIEDKVSGNPALVFPFVNNTYYKDVFPSFTPSDVRSYTWRVANVLAEAHRRGILHGDMKPLNVLLDHSGGKLFVSDWGLARFYFPNRPLSPRAGTRYWKAPELLLGCPDFAYGVDVWALGVMFAGMLNNTFHLFEGKDAHAQLGGMISHYGTKSFNSFVNKYEIQMSSSFMKKYATAQQPASKFKFDQKERSEFLTDKALDLVDKMLKFDPKDRIEMEDILKHSYFDKERKKN